jgi:hypothetical protein
MDATTPRSLRLFDSLSKQDLVPAGGVVAVDPPIYVEPKKVQVTVKSTYRPSTTTHIEVAIKKPTVDEHLGVSLDVVPIAERPKIKIPRMQRCSPFETVRNQVMPQGFYLSFTGTRGEIWCDDNKRHIAIAERSGRIQLYGKDAYSAVLNYIIEIQNKGVNTVQTVDIVCSQLGI